MMKFSAKAAGQNTAERMKSESFLLLCMNNDHFRDAAQMVHNTGVKARETSP